MTRSRRKFATLAWCAIVGLTGAQPGRAAPTTFNPVLTLDWTYSDNVDYVEPTAAESVASDQSLRVGVVLPVRREFKRGSIGFKYNWGFTKYETRDEFDDDDHRFELAYEIQPDPLGTLRTSVGYVLTQAQGDPSASRDEAADFFLSERTQRDGFSLELGYARQAGPKWGWSATSRAARFRYDVIEGATTQPAVASLESHDTYRIDFEVGRALSRRVTIGASYGYQLSELDVSGDETFHTLALTIDRQFAEEARIGLEVGGFRRSADQFADPGDEAFYENSGLYASLIADYGKEVGGVVLGFDAGVRPTAGGGLSGTSTDLTVAFTVSSAETRSWRWSVSARYTKRDPSDSREPATATSAVGGSIERAISNLIGLRVGANWADQSVGSGAIASTTSAGSFYSANVGLVYYPIGRTRLARGS